MKGSVIDETVATPQFNLSCAGANKKNNKFEGSLIAMGRKAGLDDESTPAPENPEKPAAIASADANDEEADRKMWCTQIVPPNLMLRTMATMKMSWSRTMITWMAILMLGTRMILCSVTHMRSYNARYRT
jgi:hypothetical protein